jgi:tetratricopeptide (TPR) repeat protein
MTLNQALQLHAAGKLQEAELEYIATLKTDPSNSTALGWLGMLKASTGRASDAFDLVTKALSLDPDNPDFLGLKGNLLIEQDQHQSAEIYFDKALRKQPLSPMLLIGKSTCQIAAGDFQAAINTLGKLPESLTQQSAEALLNYGKALEGLERYKEACQHFQVALDLKRGRNPAALLSLGTLHFRHREFALAAPLLERYLQSPQTDAHDHRLQQRLLLADGYRKLGRIEDALGQLNLVVSQLADTRINAEELANALFLMGACYKDSGDSAKAREHYQQALTVSPDHIETTKALGILDLTELRLKSGWGLMGKAHSLDVGEPSGYGVQVWSGEATDEKVLIQAEQGLGDEILYSTLLQEAYERAPDLSVTCDKRLIPLLSRTYPEIKFVDRASDVQLPKNAKVLRASRLGALFRNELSAFPQSLHRPLRVDPRLGKVESRLAGERRVCGMAWKSTGANYSLLKSLRLSDFQPLFEKMRLWEFCSLQYGNVSDEIAALNEGLPTQCAKLTEIHAFDVTNDIDQLASVMSTCDLIVTTSNSVAHLAGAVGAKTIVLTPEHAGRIWYWAQQVDGRSLWYPSVRVINYDSPLNPEIFNRIIDIASDKSH